MKYSSQPHTMPLELFTSDLEKLPKDNRWVRLGDSLPWDKIENIYNARLNNGKRGAGNKPARVIIGALLVKHKMGLSDIETIEAIRENPYMQYMLGLKEFTDRAVFDPSLFVAIRKRLGNSDFNDMSESLLKLQIERREERLRKQQEKNPSNKGEADDAGGSRTGGAPSDVRPTTDSSSLSPSSVSGKGASHKGVMKIYATCSDAEMRYPTDLDLLHGGCEVLERILDRLSRNASVERPATGFKAVHAAYSKIAKKKNKPGKELRRCMEYLLNALSKSIHTAFQLIARNTTACFMQLKRNDRKLFFSILKMWQQQKAMFESGVHRCDDRIVSIFQPHVRPIVRGKARAKVDFGSKIGVAMIEGYSFIDHFSWDAYNECDDMMTHLRAYKKRTGCLPQTVEADKIYLNRKNRRILRLLKIEVGGRPLGRHPKDSDPETYEARMAKFSGERNEIEANFGTGKRVYRANNIRAKLDNTGDAWCAACYFVKNVMKFLKELLYALIQDWGIRLDEALRIVLIAGIVRFRENLQPQRSL